jgi:hypothetical protein
LKKLMLIAALLAMVVVAAVPAIAQITQGNEQEPESGDSEQTFTVTGGGDNSSSCQGVQGVNNTGNAVQNTGVLQYASPDGEVEVDDSGNFAISPSSTTTCDQKVQQAASSAA